MVAEPPKFAQNISVISIGIGLNFRSFASSRVAVAKKSITVMLSINMASAADIIINKMRIFFGSKFAHFAIFWHSHLKNPDLPSPSTIIIIPAINIIVAQFIPISPPDGPALLNQKPGRNKSFIARTSITALPLPMIIP